MLLRVRVRGPPAFVTVTVCIYILRSVLVPHGRTADVVEELYDKPTQNEVVVSYIHSFLQSYISPPYSALELL